MKFPRIPSLKNVGFEIVVLYGSLLVLSAFKVVSITSDVVLLALALPVYFVFHRAVHFVESVTKKKLIEEY